MRSPDPITPEGTEQDSAASTLVTVAIGLVIGLALVFFAAEGSRFAGLRDARIEIRLNGIDERIGRDILLPAEGWVLEIELPEALPQEVLDTLHVTLREERTGATIDIQDRLLGEGHERYLVVPESLGLHAGLFSVAVRLVDSAERELVAHRRLRIRTWLGGPPIGSRQIIHFDFGVDRNGDGRADFEQDLVTLGLVSGETPELAGPLAERIAKRALARVERAYDPRHDPNGTRFELDTVFVRFLLETEPSPFVTRICVGGANASHPDSIGNVRYDHHNARKGGSECGGAPGEPASEESSGLFPGEFAIYRDNPLYQEILSPFAEDAGVGTREEDALAVRSEAPGARAAAIDRFIEVFGDALGTVMAHEAAHALGLVPAGKPGVGLFGGGEDAGTGYAHNLDEIHSSEGAAPTTPWLMNEGRSFRFEDLAGHGAAGELRFRPLNHAYLKDRVVLIDGRSKR